MCIPRRAGGRGYVLDVQADLLSNLRTRVGVPLLPPAQAPVPAKELNPVFDVDGVPHVLLTQSLAAVPLKELRNAAGTLISRRDEITRALDILLSGY